MSLVFNVIQSMENNRGRGVTEGERIAAGQASGLDDRMVDLYNRLVGGQILTPAARQQFLEVLEQNYQTELTEQLKREQQWTAIAIDKHINPELVIGTKDTLLYIEARQQFTPTLPAAGVPVTLTPGEDIPDKVPDQGIKFLDGQTVLTQAMVDRAVREQGVNPIIVIQAAAAKPLVSPEEYGALPSGAYFWGTNGKFMRKP